MSTEAPYPGRSVEVYRLEALERWKDQHEQRVAGDVAAARASAREQVENARKEFGADLGEVKDELKSLKRALWGVAFSLMTASIGFGFWALQQLASGG